MTASAQYRTCAPLAGGRSERTLSAAVSAVGLRQVRCWVGLTLMASSHESEVKVLLDRIGHTSADQEPCASSATAQAGILSESVSCSPGSRAWSGGRGRLPPRGGERCGRMAAPLDNGLSLRPFEPKEIFPISAETKLVRLGSAEALREAAHQAQRLAPHRFPTAGLRRAQAVPADPGDSFRLDL